MSYPKQVYAIYPYDDQGNVAGVYVGSAHNLMERLNFHLHDKVSQKALHQLMKENGFTYQILDTEPTEKESHLEYDWISFFISKGIKTFNTFIKDGNPLNVTQKFSYPIWNGQSIVWMMKPKQKTYPMRPFTLFAREHGMPVKKVAYSLGIRPEKFHRKQDGIIDNFSYEELITIKSLFPDVSGETVEKILFASTEASNE